MANELNSLMQADLAALKSSAHGLTSELLFPVLPAEGGQTAGLFTQSLRDAVASVDSKDKIATDRMADVDSGRSDDLVGAMLASQEASLSFSMLMQVRNKVMGAVEDLIKLPL